MKKIFVAALLLTAPAFAMAQKTGERRAPLTPEQRAERHTAHVDRTVSLTPDQRQKLHAQNLRTAEAMQAHVENIRKEKQAMRELGGQRQEAYARILTPDQMAKLKAANKERRQAHAVRGGRRMQGSGNMRPGGLKMQTPAVRE